MHIDVRTGRPGEYAAVSWSEQGLDDLLLLRLALRLIGRPTQRSSALYMKEDMGIHDIGFIHEDRGGIHDIGVIHEDRGGIYDIGGMHEDRGNRRYA